MAECFECGKEMQLKVAPVKGIFAGEEYTVRTEALVCPSCHFTTVDAPHLDEYYKAIADAYRHKHNLLTSTQIRNVRLQMQMSQEQFANYLGAGIASIKRWELGQAQERAMDELIRLKTDYAYAQENKFGVLIKQGGPSDEYSGWTPFRVQKFQETVLFFIGKLEEAKQKPKPFHMPLLTNKLLWFADAYHAQKHGKSITGLRYARIDRGPVPDDYVSLYQILQRQQLIDYRNAETLIAKRSFAPDVFSKEELDSLEHTWNRFGNKLEEVEETSHREKAFRDTDHAQLISFKKVVE